MAPDHVEHALPDVLPRIGKKRSRAVRSKVWDIVSAAWVMLGCAVAFIPFVPSFPADQLDSAWAFALNAAVEHGLAFGRDIVFTFGPYASLYTFNYDPATDGLAMSAGVAVAVAVCSGLVALSRGWARWGAILVSLLFSLVALRDALFLVVPLLFLAVIARFVTVPRSDGRRLAVAGVLLLLALALLPLTKATFAAAALAAAAAAGLLLLRKDWRLAVGAACLFLLAMTSFWCLAHQHLSDLPRFFVAQRAIVPGYAAAMSLEGPVWQVVAFWVAAAAVLAANGFPLARLGLPGLAVWLLSAALIFLSFKSGFIRQDEHVLISAGTLGLIAAMLSVFSPGRAAAVGLVSGLAGWSALVCAYVAPDPLAVLQRLDSVYARTAAGALERAIDPGALHREYDGALAKIRAAHPLPNISGTTDAYTDQQSIPLAYGFAWSPRPLLQSYSAWSPLLATLDAQHLDGPGAPQNVLLALQPIDGRLPALEDGLSWLSLLTRYDAIALQDDLVVLRRRDAGMPPGSPLVRGGQQTGRFGKEVPLSPSDAPLWAEIDVEPTWPGRVMTALFKPPPLSLTLRLADGARLKFRYIAGMGKTGFVISPLVANAAEMVMLSSPASGLAGKSVAGFEIDGDSRFWRAKYRMTLSSLHLSIQAHALAVLFPRPVRAEAGTDHNAHCFLDQADGQVVDHRAPALQLSGPVQASGWGYGADMPGTAPENVSVSLTALDGTVVAAHAVVTNRPDVGLYFHQPNLQKVGFQVRLDLGGLSGRFRMNLEMQAGGHHWSCPLSNSVEIAAPPAAQ